MIRLLVTAATLSGLLRHVFGRERVARGGARRKAWPSRPASAKRFAERDKSLI